MVIKMIIKKKYRKISKISEKEIYKEMNKLFTDKLSIQNKINNINFFQYFNNFINYNKFYFLILIIIIIYLKRYYI